MGALIDKANQARLEGLIERAGDEGRMVLKGAPPGGALADGAFQDCSGLEVEMDVQEYQEGGRNDGAIRQVGRVKLQNIVLKRGMSAGCFGASSIIHFSYGQRAIVNRDETEHAVERPVLVLGGT